tara:strand:- start:6405 stop:7592 length:1188 start_codon:yes stop_codon:yes gene_type:complete
MLTENRLLAAAMHSRDAADQLELQSIRYQFTPPAQVVWDQLVLFYQKDDEAKTVDKEVVLSRLQRKYPKQENFESFKGIVDGLDDISVPNVLEELKQFKLETMAQELSCMFADKMFDAADKLLDSYNNLRTSDSAGGIEDKLIIAPEVLGIDALNKDRVKLLPMALNSFIGGGVPKATHILVFARPEMGKTAMLLSMVKGFLNQGLNVVYLGNEEDPDMVNARLIARMTDNTIMAVRQNNVKAREVAMTRGYENFTFLDTEQGTKAEMEQAIISRNADVMFIDQLRNVSTKEDNTTAAYENLGRYARTLSKKHNMIMVSAVQAGASAEGKIQLDMNDVDGSKTGLAGATDLMLGLGANDQMKLDGKIMVTACRNKINGRHGGILCQLDPLKSKVW